MNNPIAQGQERLARIRPSISGMSLEELIDTRNEVLDILDTTYSEVARLKSALRDGYMAMEFIDEMERIVVASIMDRSAKDEAKDELKRLNHGFTD